MMVNYSEMVERLAKSGEAILSELTPLKAAVDHAAKGIAGEAGEVVGAIKRWTVYGKELDRENVVEELGDLEFFMEHLRAKLGITREETIEANVKKLSVRYSAGAYSDAAAIARADKHL